MLRTLAITLFVAAVLPVPASAQPRPNPDAARANAVKGRPCRDPWINLAFADAGLGMPAGQGDAGDCNPQLYRGGSWSSYEQLFQAVKATRGALRTAGLDTRLAASSDKRSLVPVLVDTRGQLVARFGTNISAQIIAGNTANIVTDNGGTLQVSAERFISNNGSTFQSLPSATVNTNPGYRLQSARRTVQLPQGVLIVP